MMESIEGKEMFIDYSPWPAKPLFVNVWSFNFHLHKDMFGGEIPLRIQAPNPDAEIPLLVVPKPINKIITVDLNLYVYRVDHSRSPVEVAYGWYAPERTLLIHADYEPRRQPMARYGRSPIPG